MLINARFRPTPGGFVAQASRLCHSRDGCATRRQGLRCQQILVCREESAAAQGTPASLLCRAWLEVGKSFYAHRIGLFGTLHPTSDWPISTTMSTTGFITYRTDVRSSDPHPLRKRLWKIAIAAWAILAVLIAFDAKNRLSDPSPKLALGHDLLPSYAAGQLVREGRASAMYDRDAISAVERKVIRDADLLIDDRYGPWLNPPFFAFAFVPLSALPYRQAAATFLCVNIILLAASLILLTRMLRDDDAATGPADENPHLTSKQDAACEELIIPSRNLPAPEQPKLERSGIVGSASADADRVRSCDEHLFTSNATASAEADPTIRLFHASRVRRGRMTTQHNGIPAAQSKANFVFRPKSCHEIERSGGQRPGWKTLALVPVIAMLPLPVWQAMGHQQNTFISFFLLTFAVWLWRANRPFVAGLIGGLLFFKPQLAALFALAMVIGLGWRALAGLAVTGVWLLAITVFSMPGCLHEFLHRLPPILHWLQNVAPYNWGRQVTFQSFWRSDDPGACSRRNDRGR